MKKLRLIIAPLLILPFAIGCSNNAKKWYEFPDWWNYCSTPHSNAQMANKKTDVGQIVYAEVNGLMHQVRLIDVDHIGVDGVHPEAHCTFEFANVITDYNGVPTTGWASSDNSNFPDSTLNDFLNNNDDCIFNKLPDGLQSAIKTVDKKVAAGKPFAITSYPTKLFPLAHDEMVNHEGDVLEGEGAIYKYYDNDGVELGKARVGKLGWDRYWLRSPDNSSNSYVWQCNVGGAIVAISVTGFENAVAPAFCI